MPATAPGVRVALAWSSINAMWDEIGEYARPCDWEAGARIVGGLPLRTERIEEWLADPATQVHGRRFEYTARYSWSITDPGTVAFVAKHAGPRVVDPLAGSGWWAYLLGQAGVDVHASDLHPAGSSGAVVHNRWHRDVAPHAPMAVMDGVESVRAHGADRTLLLAWPPYGEPVGTNILRAYPGDRVIYIGEGGGGCCGDDEMFDVLDGWDEVALHRPVQWWGIRDYVTVYQRPPAVEADQQPDLVAHGVR